MTAILRKYLPFHSFAITAIILAIIILVAVPSWRKKLVLYAHTFLQRIPRLQHAVFQLNETFFQFFDRVLTLRDDFLHEAKARLMLMPFVLGIGLALGGLSVAGYVMTATNMFMDYHRSYRSISPEALFYPTARQIVALTDSKLDQSKIAIIIAGSSVMRGTGQSVKELWSDKLAEILGNDFSLINLALNGGGAAGQGQYIAEKLVREGRRVIVISDIGDVLGQITADNDKFYRGFYFDAEARDIVTDYAPRRTYIKNALLTNDPDAYYENAIQSRLNEWLNFNDFWNTLGYQDFFTVWTRLTSNAPWAARVNFKDDEVFDPKLRYYNPLNAELGIIRGAITAKPSISDTNAMLANVMPPELKAHTVFVARSSAPYYKKHLTTDELAAYEAQMNLTAQEFTKAGLNCYTIGIEKPAIFNDEDYIDRDHFSGSGGEKFAKLVAPLILTKAKELHYVP